MEINIYQELLKKLNKGEPISIKDYLFLLSVAQIPQLAYLRETKGDVFNDETLWKTNTALATEQKNYIENIKAEISRLKKAKEPELASANDDAYDEAIWRYNAELQRITTQKTLLLGAKLALKHFTNLPTYQQKMSLVLYDIEKNLQELEEKNKKPEQKSVEEYREGRIAYLEDFLKKYEEEIQKLSEQNIPDSDELTKDFMRVLNNLMI